MKHTYSLITNPDLRQAAAMHLSVIRGCRDVAQRRCDRVERDRRYGVHAFEITLGRVHYWHNDIVSARDMLAALGGQQHRKG